MITELQQNVFERYHGDKHLSEFYLQDGGKKSTSTDMEQNYVIVTLWPMYYLFRVDAFSGSPV